MRNISMLVAVAFTLALTACGTQGMSDQFQRQSLVAASGSLDTTYGTAGLTGLDGSSASSMALQGDGKAVVLTENDSGVYFNRTVTLTRLTRNGQPDVNFGQNGAVEVDGANGAMALLCPNGANAYNDWGAACQDPERAVVVATDVTADVPRQTFLKIYRFLPSGQPDPSFGQNGVLIVSNRFYSTVSTLMIQADGKMLLAGNLIDDSDINQAFVARLQRNGTPDSTFGDAGLALLPLDRTVLRMVLPKSEHPVVLTYRFVEPSRVELFRLTDRGLPDTNFGIGGVVSLNLNVGTYGELFSILAMDNGRLVVGGYGSLWRLLSNGTPDLNFGVNGQAVFPDLEFQSITLDQQNRLVAGVGAPVANDVATMARLHANGSLDASFGIGGLSHVVIIGGSHWSGFHLVAVQRNGRILGVAESGVRHFRWVTAARLLP